MQTIRLIVFFYPGTAHLDSITARAEQAIELGLLSSLPEIAVEPSGPSFWVIVLKIKPADRPFWMGFYLGKDWCINNRPLAVGTD